MSKDMTRGCTWKLILFFSLPLVIGNIFQQFYSMVDTIIVGRYVSVDALAAVGATGAVSFLVLGFVIGVTSGFGVIISQRFGAEDENGLKKAVALSIVLSVVISVVLTIASVGSTDFMLHLMNTPENIYSDARTYIIIIFAGVGASVYYNLIAAILRALGDSKTPLYFLVLSSVINIGLDLLFIIQFKMGVAGAGYATVISQLISAVACTFYTLKRYDILKLSKVDFKWDGVYVLNLLKVGLPMAFQFSITAIGVMVLQGALNAFGSDTVAAYTVGSKVEMVVSQPFVALGVTMATFCGQNLGAGRFDRIKKGVREGMLLCFCACLLAVACMVFGGPFCVRLFMENPSAEIVTQAQQYLNTISVFFVILGLLLLFRNVMQGMGYALLPTLGGVGELVARFVVSIVLPGMIGYAGICLASPIAWIVAVVPQMIAFFCISRKWTD